MGYSVSDSYGQLNFKMQQRQTDRISFNTKIAMWQLPYDSRYKDYDEDGSKWFEKSNQNGRDEIKRAEKGLNMDFSPYKVIIVTDWYDDDTYDIKSTYPNNTVIESHGANHVFVRIKDKSDKLAAEKIFGFDSNDGKKTIYKSYTQGKYTLTVVRVYKFDTTKNKATDVVNYAYTSDTSKLTDGCTFYKEFCLLNGKQVDVTKNDSGGYVVKIEDGKILTFQVE